MFTHIIKIKFINIQNHVNYFITNDFNNIDIIDSCTPEYCICINCLKDMLKLFEEDK